MIELSHVDVRVGDFRARDLSFTVPRGSYAVVIGPAGAGKTTLLETIAGVVTPERGVIRLRGEDVTQLPPELRRVGIVYQHAYLFPHLSVAENVAYGADDKAVAREMTERFGLDALTGRSVQTLSGGERQLVALARTFAANPDIVLLDEPFAALDPRTRITARRQVRALHAERGLTVLHVTHDLAEAGRLGHMVVLLEKGRVLQVGAPDEVFRKPASPAVADFVGAENVIPGTARGVSADAGGERIVEFRSKELVLHAVSDAPDGAVHAVIRAEEIALSPEMRASSVRNQVAARVVELAPAGVITRVTVDAGGVELVAAITTRSAEDLKLVPGNEVVAAVKATAVHLC